MLEESRRAGPRPQSVTQPKPSMVIPVVGIHSSELHDTFGNARGEGRTHQGIDIFAAHGTVVVAAMSGAIEYIGVRPRPGRCLWIAGEDGFSYFYAHLSSWAPGLAVGSAVRAGEIIGAVGNSGNAAGSSPHLHFEIRSDDAPVNPYPRLMHAAEVNAPSVELAAGNR